MDAAFLVDNLWLLIVPAAAAGLWLGYRREQERSKALREAGRALGLHPSDEDRVPAGLLELALFQEGHSKTVENVLWAEKRDYLVFEYRYTVGSGKHSHTYSQTAGAFHCPGRAMPAFAAAPEELSDKIAGFFGGQDIDFDGDSEFSKRYRLRGADEAAIRDFFSVGGTQYLAARPGWTVQAKGEWLMAYRSDERAKPAKLRDFLWDLQGLYGALLGV